MSKDIVRLTEDLSDSPLYSPDLAPVPPEKRTWNVWNLAAIWVGMAVCIPTYILASYMISQGIDWWVALLIIGLANLIITVPMVLNGHAGVKYGIPFPVLGRAAFGTRGVHIPAVARGLVACGWFGVQTWIGGLAIYAIICELVPGLSYESSLTVGNFGTFILFWLINIYFIWRGTESIKWLETWSAPILVIMGLILIGWGYNSAGSFGQVLKQSEQLQKSTASIRHYNGELMLFLEPLRDADGTIKATEYQLTFEGSENDTLPWKPVRTDNAPLALGSFFEQNSAIAEGDASIFVQFRQELGQEGNESTASAMDYNYSSTVQAQLLGRKDSKWLIWLFWLTGMVGFWATMSLSIADITRYASTQADQVKGQFIGLPGTMVLYSFVGIFVTCAAVINFKDILIGPDAPWDPVSLLARFESPVVVVIAQLFMLVATLSTNIAANVIAPANAFSNLWPRKVSFAAGGLITGVIGILIVPWKLLGSISGFLLLVSAFLGPVLGILLADYFTVRRTKLDLAALYKPDGVYAYGGSGFNMAAIAALLLGIGTVGLGKLIPSLGILYDAAWFTGFGVAYIAYVLLMRRQSAAAL